MRLSRGEATTMAQAFGLAIVGAGVTAWDDKNDATSDVVTYMTRRGEDDETDMVVFLRPPFFRDVCALRFFGRTYGLAAAGDGAIAENIPLQSL